MRPRWRLTFGGVGLLVEGDGALVAVGGAIDGAILPLRLCQRDARVSRAFGIF
jgi:hypothetical protein